jgi:hypothetical protein
MVGEDDAINEFESDFYSRLKNKVIEKYDADEFSLASLKINQLAEDSITGRVSGFHENDNRIVFAQLAPAAFPISTCGGGYFYVCHLKDVEGLIPYVHSKVQTLTYFGFNKKEIEKIADLTSGKGIDRLVPLGKALDFHYLWDGYNLIDELSRKKYIA